MDKLKVVVVIIGKDLVIAKGSITSERSITTFDKILVAYANGEW